VHVPPAAQQVLSAPPKGTTHCFGQQNSPSTMLPDGVKRSLTQRCSTPQLLPEGQ
jgi:hypothetical protein